MSEPQRKKITERLLRMRLGLDEDWFTLDDEGKAQLPTALPGFVTHELSKREIKELEAALDRLVAAGCHRGVLIFCLLQLSPRAREIQAGGEWVSKDEPETPAKRLRELATKEELEPIVNALTKAIRLIVRYRRELLWVAETEPPLVHSTLRGEFKFTDVDEAFLSLLKSLDWVRGLAKSYSAPFGKLLMQSKELLYLTLYVSRFADAEKLRKSQHHAESQESAVRSRRKRPTKRGVLPEHALAHVVSLCTSRHWVPSELYATLKRFKGDYPALYLELARKMAALHRNAV
jgi:hypothetical protein